MQTNDALEALKALYAVRPADYDDGGLKENDPEQHRAWKRAEMLIKRNDKTVRFLGVAIGRAA